MKIVLGKNIKPGEIFSGVKQSYKFLRICTIPATKSEHGFCQILDNNDKFIIMPNGHYQLYNIKSLVVKKK